jgi:hypothetical protein
MCVSNSTPKSAKWLRKNGWLVHRGFVYGAKEWYRRECNVYAGPFSECIWPGLLLRGRSPKLDVRRYKKKSPAGWHVAKTLAPADPTFFVHRFVRVRLCDIIAADSVELACRQFEFVSRATIRNLRRVLRAR